MPLRVDILTLFPEMFPPVLGSSILKRAAEKGLVEYYLTNFRDYATDAHKSVDDKPFGGGPGMVMMAPVVFDAVADVEQKDARPATRILLTPQGRRFDQPLAQELSRHPRLLLIAGHYEGFDERIIEGLRPLELSIGDYVLTGGELPAMTRRSQTGCWSTRSTRGRASFAGRRYPTCCSAATTPPSRNGGWSKEK